jgi:hypothetical protein
MASSTLSGGALAGEVQNLELVPNWDKLGGPSTEDVRRSVLCSTVKNESWYKVLFDRLSALQPSDISDTGIPSGSNLMPLGLLDLKSLPGSHLVSYLAYIVIHCVSLAARGVKDNSKFPNITEKFNKFWNHDITLPTPPPDIRFSSGLAKTFERKSPQSRALLGPLVWTLKNPPQVLQVEILSEDVLAPLENKFTTALKWYVKFVSLGYKEKLNNKNVFLLTFDIINFKKWCDILEKIDNKLRNKVTWKWAHLFTKRDIAEITMDHHSLFTLTCIALVGQSEWQTDQIRPYLKDKERAIKIANDILLL